MKPSDAPYGAVKALSEPFVGELIPRVGLGKEKAQKRKRLKAGRKPLADSLTQGQTSRERALRLIGDTRHPRLMG
jgi:hypothetical protein